MRSKLPCRLCLAHYSRNALKNVFTCKIKHSTDSLVDVLFWVFSVEIDATDPYAKDICHECLVLVEYVVEVRDMFRKNQEGLKEDQGNKTFQGWSRNQSLDSIQGSSDEQTRENSATPSSISSKSSYYGTSSPRVRVSLATLESLCSLRLDVEKLETSPEYMRYRQIGNGRYKKRKYRHFNLDDTILDDICKTLDGENWDDPEIFKKDVGISTALPTASKAVNTDESYYIISKSEAFKKHVSTTDLCRASKANESCHWGRLPVGINGQLMPSPELVGVPSIERSDDGDLDESMIDILQITRGISSSLLSPDANNKEYDWTRTSFQRDASTNTDPNNYLSVPNKTIDINAPADKVDVGTLTKAFKRMRKKDEVKINIKSLDSFSPRVWLEPVEYHLGRENYIQTNDFSFTKKEVVSSETEPSESGSDDYTESQKDAVEVKKQRFLDYYNNFSSFAVRELIAGKTIRNSDFEPTPVFKVANVCKVLVCNFCSKTFMSEAFLNLHYKNKHRSFIRSNLIGKSRETRQSRNIAVKRLKGRRATPPIGAKLPLLTETDPTCISPTPKKNNHRCTSPSMKLEDPSPPLGCEILREDSSSCLPSNIRRNLPYSLRAKGKVKNKNVDTNMLRSRMKVQQQIASNKKRRGRKPGKKSINEAVRASEEDEKEGPSYVWDRKGLHKIRDRPKPRNEAARASEDDEKEEPSCIGDRQGLNKMRGRKPGPKPTNKAARASGEDEEEGASNIWDGKSLNKSRGKKPGTKPTNEAARASGEDKEEETPNIRGRESLNKIRGKKPGPKPTNEGAGASGEDKEEETSDIRDRKSSNKIRGKKPGPKPTNEAARASEEDAQEPSYIWDRKGLGTYSAITFYQNHKSENVKDKQSDLNNKSDVGLNATIQKLADRLERFDGSDSDSDTKKCDPT